MVHSLLGALFQMIIIGCLFQAAGRGLGFWREHNPSSFQISAGMNYFFENSVTRSFII